MSGGKFSPVLLPLFRKVMPNVLAHDILGVQPMTGPVGSIFALRAKYGRRWPKMEWACGLTFPNTVFFHHKHDVRDNTQAVFMWALENCKGLYSYTVHVQQGPQPLDPETGELITDEQEGWLWSFADPYEAFWFKLRWL